MPLGKRVAESEKHSVKFVSVTTLKIVNANEAPDQRAISMHRENQSAGDTYGKTSHPYSPDSLGFHRI